ncbi:CbtB domain-containing protein [Nisaea sp.]|uniref:CbtB domain-containing protein n=1 Tax=Nisaea sp. TaxID=2024842 RepID=UPI002B26D190|nr:CbtB domain-containing protein [Nisaea sp.]
MTSAVQKSTSLTASQSTKMVAVFALLAGLGIVYLTGFANATALHNTAHDTRHSMAFPCH